MREGGRCWREDQGGVVVGAAPLSMQMCADVGLSAR